VAAVVVRVKQQPQPLAQQGAQVVAVVAAAVRQETGLIVAQGVTVAGAN
jgi:hypothetical protein